MLASFVTAPFTSYVSRGYEHQADEFALSLAHDPQAGIDGFKKVSYQSMMDPDPSSLLQWWFGTHPTMAERIKYLELQK